MSCKEKTLTSLLSPRFLFTNAMGILLTPSSIRSSVRPQKYTVVNTSVRMTGRTNLPSVCPSPHKPLGGILPNLLHNFPSGLWCARAALFFCASVRPCVPRPSICLLYYLLLNHWAEFTSPRSKGVQEFKLFVMCLELAFFVKANTCQEYVQNARMHRLMLVFAVSVLCLLPA